MRFFDHTLAVGTGGGLLAWSVRTVNEYGAAIITLLTITYLILGIRNRWTKTKEEK